ncbi:MAG: Protease 3 [Candidatus Anoxychlamydiales bacterium]|nr:Protease 3 [Candidatus Anoxychlamydiales bacterium]
MPSFKFLFIFLFSIFNIFAMDTKYQIVEDKSNLKILNPSLKDRNTLKFRLSNGMKVYIISDKNTDKSAAAISVLAGSWDDPKEFPGMAHFCEHMLFKGSKKYPKESEYMKFIWDNSGVPNAYTASDRTVYMFSVNDSAFEEALDRLSYFFKDPIFDPSHIAKELYAVDQEHSKNIENDGRRAHMVSKEIGNQNHPNAKFSTGNAKTLQSIPPSELRKWYEKHYSANQMALVIYSNKDLDELTKLVVEKFTPIANIGKDQITTKESIFNKENSGKITYIKPISNIQFLLVEWELDRKFTFDETKSADLIAYTLKRGQKNSLLEVLKKEHLAEDLDIVVEKAGSDQSLFILEIKLTDLGIKNAAKVISRSFEAINNLKKSSIPNYLFHEMKTMSKLNYEYQAHQDAFEFVSEHAANLLYEDLSTYPKKNVLASEYSSENVNQILDSLNFSSSQIYLIADPKKTNVKLDQKEKWTNAKYSVKELDKSLKNRLSKNPTNPNIKLPEPNSFIPTNLQMNTTKENFTNEKAPAKIVSDDFATIFYLKDDKYRVPQVSWHFQIKDEIFDETVKSDVLKDLYVKALLEKLAPTIYSAEEAGLYPSITSDTFNIRIDIFGYSAKASFLLEEILKAINNLQISKEQFDIYYSSLYKDYQNSQKILPVFQAKNYLQSILSPSSFTSIDKLDTLKRIQFRDFIKFKNKVFETCYVEGFLTGNLSLKEAESIWLDIKDSLRQKPFLPKDHYKKKVFVINDNKGPYLIHQKIDVLGNGVVLAIDQDSFSFENRAAQSILSQTLREAFFTSLRSDQKTAYIAHSTDIELQKHLYQLFFVQSSSHNVKDLLSRFEIFIEDYEDNIETKVPEDRFDNIKNSLIQNMENPYKNLQEMSSTLNYIAFEKEKDFLWHEKRIEAMQKLTYPEFIAFCKKTLSKDNKKRLAILFEGKLDKDFKYTKLEDKEHKTIGFYKTDNLENVQ